VEIIDVVINCLWFVILSYFVWLYVRHLTRPEVLYRQVGDFLDIGGHIGRFVKGLRIFITRRHVFAALAVLVVLKLHYWMRYLLYFWDTDYYVRTTHKTFSALPEGLGKIPDVVYSIMNRATTGLMMSVLNLPAINKLFVVCAGITFLIGFRWVLKRLVQMRYDLDDPLYRRLQHFALGVLAVAIASLAVTAVVVAFEPDLLAIGQLQETPRTAILNTVWASPEARPPQPWILLTIYPFWLSISLPAGALFMSGFLVYAIRTVRGQVIKWDLVLVESLRIFFPMLLFFAGYEIVGDTRYWLVLIGSFVGLEKTLYAPAAVITAAIIQFFRVCGYVVIFYYPFVCALGTFNWRRSIRANFAMMRVNFGATAGMLLLAIVLFGIVLGAFHPLLGVCERTWGEGSLPAYLVEILCDLVLLVMSGGFVFAFVDFSMSRLGKVRDWVEGLSLIAS